jgi:chemotaxis protein MotB
VSNKAANVYHLPNSGEVNKSPSGKHPSMMTFPSSRKKHDDGESIWLISYSDLMTLLMGFFALMMSMSTIDPNKTAAVQEAASKVFGGTVERPLDALAKELEKVLIQEGIKDQVKIESKITGITLVFTGTLLFDSGSVQLRSDANQLFDKIIV